MNIKAMAAIVGTLSLGALATGCATTKPAAAASEEKGSESACKGTSAAGTEEKGSENACKGTSATSTEKGSESSCGANGCGGAQKKE